MTEVKTMTIDVSKYRKGSWYNLGNLGDDVPLEEIVDVEEGQYEKLVLVFKSRNRLSLNGGNLELMCRHYGEDHRRWIGLTIKLISGERKFNGKMVPSIILVPVSPDVVPTERTSKETRGGDVNRPLDDEIPF